MGGQVWGGGIIVLVAVVLWLVYLLPSWHSRRQYDAAERNAVRLNQALRVLAETSETPEEVRLELSARTAAAQQRLAKRALAEREHAALEEARVDLERARTEREAVEAAARVDVARARAERAEAEAAARAELAAARALPALRRARARRRFRLVATLVGIAGVGVAAWGVFQTVTAGAQTLLWTGVGLVAASLLVLHRMSRVASRAAARGVDVVPYRAGAAELQDVALEQEPRTWAPRELPRPLTASAGSRAAAVLDAEAARQALRQAALEEAMLARTTATQTPSLDAARAARPAAAENSEFSRMGYVDDEEIEAHVRALLTRRASGQ
ncbi:large exoprotein [Microbacterium sp. M3]|uniref:Large exoprotein n=1 Tax=Microbacterium arthrosphaerae TaxID=792652 RepID=A0ABU4GY50_9MICO|nr:MULTISPECIES: large exoprotein [Microbacterium]MDW4571379.1 large exoprotein [Microbacterium arthrosphaerae]MDW7605234.1 large exoprotein [Microbacterium sp. M3]